MKKKHVVKLRQGRQEIALDQKRFRRFVEPRFKEFMHYLESQHVQNSSDDEGDDEDNDDLSEMAPPRLLYLLSTTETENHCYVYDVFMYAELYDRNGYLLKVQTEDTLRMSIVSTVLIGIQKQPDNILGWAVKQGLLRTIKIPASVRHEVLNEEAILIAMVAETVVKLILDLEPEHHIQISIAIGDWHEYKKSNSSHEMIPSYDVSPLIKLLEDQGIINKTLRQYKQATKSMISSLAVLICHHFFFYLASSDYKTHRFLVDIEKLNQDKTIRILKESANKKHDAREYSQAVNLYSQAIDRSPYWHVLYTNRAASYLKLAEQLQEKGMDYAYKAMCDAFRGTKINPRYVKAHFRYAQALTQLNRISEATDSLKKACDSLRRIPADLIDGEIKTLNNLLRKLVEDNHAKTDTSTGVSKPKRLDSSASSDVIIQQGEPSSDQPLNPTLTTEPEKVIKDEKIAGFPKISDESQTDPKAEFNESLKEATESMLSRKYQYSLTLYDKCFSLINKLSSASLGVTQEQILKLRFCKGVALISGKTAEDIVLGIKEFKRLVDENLSSTLKSLCLFYLCKAYARQHRYTEAITLTDDLIGQVDGRLPVEPLAWPGTDVIIEESDPETFETSCMTLLQTCQNPPKADYKCSMNTCISYGYYHHFIYLDSPDFKGYVKEFCTNHCVLAYHPSCWKKHTHQKAILNSACFTPDCGGIIYKFIIYNEEGLKDNEEFIKIPGKPKIKKPKNRSPPISQYKIEKLKAKKEIKKEKRAKYKQKVPEIEMSAEKEAKKDEAGSNDQPDLRKEPVCVINKRKEEIEEAEQNAQLNRKSQRRPKKQNWSFFEESQQPYDFGSDQPFAIPSHLRYRLEYFDRLYDQEQGHVSNHQYNTLESSLISFYYELLSECPIAVDSPELNEYIDNEPAAKEAVNKYGGLPEFLLSSHVFFLNGSFICVREEFRQTSMDEVEEVQYTESEPIDSTTNLSAAITKLSAATTKLSAATTNLSAATTKLSAATTNLSAEAQPFMPRGMNITVNETAQSSFFDELFQELPSHIDVSSSSSGYSCNRMNFSMNENPSLEISIIKPEWSCNSNSEHCNSAYGVVSRLSESSTFDGCSSISRSSEELHTEVEPEMVDKECQTDYALMNDLEKKLEEHELLVSRLADLEDKFTQYRKTKSSELAVVTEKLEETQLLLEETKNSAHERHEKEARKWKEERKRMKDELTESKHSIEECRQTIDKQKALLDSQQRGLDLESEQQRKILKALLDGALKRAIFAEAEIISMREKECMEPIIKLLSALESQMNSLNQHLEKMVRAGFRPHVLGSSLRDELCALILHLTEMRDEKSQLFTKQKDDILSGQSSLSNMSKYPPPNIQDLSAIGAELISKSQVVINQSAAHMTMNPTQPAQTRQDQVNHQHPAQANNQLPVPHTYKLYTEGPETRNMPSASHHQAQPASQQSTNTPHSQQKQLIDEIISIYPQKTREDVLRYIQIVRARKTKLSGIKISDIKQEILEIIAEEPQSFR